MGGDLRGRMERPTNINTTIDFFLSRSSKRILQAVTIKTCLRLQEEEKRQEKADKAKMESETKEEDVALKEMTGPTAQKGTFWCHGILILMVLGAVAGMIPISVLRLGFKPCKGRVFKCGG